ncbi:hypothetical protein EYF80_062842 [Liparis tanakae]|uniref:Uncharacterized protein n=1 Tax=Liparis tanakae TaxID=230148 RepID=A0A4Z2EDQ9_9TELE|nr:hypothetical protein EYF80_062842 [Liparis tanakae]
MTPILEPPTWRQTRKQNGPTVRARSRQTASKAFARLRTKNGAKTRSLHVAKDKKVNQKWREKHK